MSKFIDRPDYVRKLKDALLATRSPIVGLRGPGGFGKTTLAHLLEIDVEVRKQFDGGFHWISLGTEQTEATLLAKIKSILATSGAPNNDIQDVYIASRELSKILNEKKSLIIIDDAWNAKDVIPFIPSNFQGKVIITAREADVFPQGTEIFQIDGMSNEESYALLSATIEQAKPELFETLLRKVSGWPVLLALLNGRICEDISDGISLEKSLSDVEKLYDNAGLRGFDLNSKSYRNQEITSTLYYSVGRLDEAIRANFLYISIFPDDVKIPVRILASVWNVSEQLALEICRKFYRCSLLLEFNRVDPGNEFVRLHDVVRDVLRAHPDVELTRLNSEFLESFRPQSENGRWAALDQTFSYLWTHLPWHLSEANLWDEYKSSFFDLEYLAKHSLYVGRRSTEVALRQIGKLYPETNTLLKFFERMGHLLDSLSSHSDRQATIASHMRSNDWPKLTHLRIDWQVREIASHDMPGHVGGVLCCAANDELRLLLTGSSDTTLRIWDMDSCEERAVLHGHSSWVRACAIDRAGKMAISASDDGTVKLWSIPDGNLIRTFEGHADSVRACDFSPAGDWIASSSSDGTARIWKLTDGTCSHVLEGQNGAIWCIKAIPDGSGILTGSADGTLRLWDFQSGNVTMELQGHRGGVRSCDVSPDGRYAVSASDDRSLITWDLSNGAIVRILEGHLRQVRGCAIGPDGCTVVSAGGDDSRAIVWDLATGEQLVALSGHLSWVMACCFADFGHSVVSASVDGTAIIWDLRSGMAKRMTLGQPTILWAGALGVTECAVASVTGTLHRLDFANGNLISSVAMNSGCIRDIALDHTQHAIIAVSDDTTIQQLDLETMLTREIGRHSRPVRACAISDDGAMLITGGEDGVLKAWKSVAGDQRAFSFSHDIGDATSTIQDCAFMYDASRDTAMTVHSDGKARIWDIRNRTEIKQFDCGKAPLTCCAVHPNQAKIIAIGTEDAKILLYDLDSGNRIAQFSHKDWISGIEFSPDGTLLGSTSDDLTLRIWDIESSALVAAIALRESVFGCNWHPNGSQLLAVGAGGAARVSISRGNLTDGKGSGFD